MTSGARSRALAVPSFTGPLHQPGAGIPAGTDEMYVVLHLLSHGASWRRLELLRIRRDLRHQQTSFPTKQTQSSDVHQTGGTPHLDAWLAWAQRSKLKPFVRLARTLRRYRDGILAAITLGLSNARLEGLHSKVRLLSHRSFGFHSAAPLIALICLDLALSAAPRRDRGAGTSA